MIASHLIQLICGKFIHWKPKVIKIQNQVSKALMWLKLKTILDYVTSPVEFVCTSKGKSEIAGVFRHSLLVSNHLMIAGFWSGVPKELKCSSIVLLHDMVCFHSEVVASCIQDGLILLGGGILPFCFHLETAYASHAFIRFERYISCWFLDFPHI